MKHYDAIIAGFDSNALAIAKDLSRRYENILIVKQKEDTNETIYNIPIIYGDIKLLDEHKVKINDEIFEADYIYFSNKETKTNADTSKPKRIAILNGNYIGLELASMYATLGNDVTIFETEKNIISNEDSDVSNEIRKNLQKQHIEFMFNTTINEILNINQKIVLNYLHLFTNMKRTFDTVFIGEPIINDEQNIHNRFIQIDVPNLESTKDTKGLQFSYFSLDSNKSIREYLSYDSNIPYSLFVSPTFSKVGLNEKEAIHQGYDIKIATLKNNNYLKAIIDKKTDHILGIVILDDDSERLINFISSAMDQNVPYQDIRDHIFRPYDTNVFKELFVHI